MANLDPLIQKVVLQAESTMAPQGLAGLDATIAKLETVEAHLRAIDALSSKGSTAFRRSGDQFASDIKAKGEKGAQPTENIAQMFGFSPQDIRDYGVQIERETREAVRKLQRELGEMSKTTPGGNPSKAYQTRAEKLAAAESELFFTSAAATAFRSPQRAGEFLEKFQKTQRSRMQEMLGGKTPTVAQMQAGAKVAGQIILEIPASQITARVVGEVGAMGGGMGRDTTTGQFTGGSGGAGGSRKKSSRGKGLGSPYNPPASPEELQRVITESENSIRTTISEMAAVGEMMDTTYDDLGKEVKTKLRISSKSPLMQGLAQSQAEFAARLRAGTAANKGDPAALAALKLEAAAHLEGMIGPDLAAQLAAKGVTMPQARISGQAQVLRAQAAAMQQTIAQQNAAKVAAASAYAPFNYQAFINATMGPQPQTPHAQQQAYYSRIFGAAGAAGGPGVPPVIPVAPPGAVPPRIPGARGAGSGAGGGSHWMRSFTPLGYAANVGTVAGWAAAVYPVMMLRDALEGVAQKTIEVQTQTARLENVFRGAGGSAQDLSADILKLAAATGVDTDAALTTATAWARLGFSRAQVDVATRQTAILANTGQMDMGTAQKSLATLMSNYKFGVEGIAPVVGGLTTANARSGIPQQEILAGLARVSPLTSGPNGIPLPELMAILAAGARRTNESGVTTANALRQHLSELLKTGPGETDEQLQREFGIKRQPNLGAYWQSIAQDYAKETPERQQLMARIVGGGQRGSATRFMAYMDSFSQAQALQSDMYKNPKAGEEAQRRLMDTLQYSWQGLKSTVQGRVTAAVTNPGMTGISVAGGLSSFMNLVSHAWSSTPALDRLGNWMENKSPLARLGQLLGMASSGWTPQGGMDAPGTGATGGAVPQEEQDLELKHQEMLNYLTERKALLEGIMKVTTELASVGEEGQVLARRGALQAQAGAIDTAIQGVPGLHLSGDEADKLNTELQNMRLATAAQLSASATEQALAQISDQRRIAAERASGFSQEAGIVGHTPLEQMLNRGRGLDREIGRLLDQPARTDMESARLLQLQKDRYQNYVDEGRRTEELPDLIKQNQQESARSFARETLFAGPREMLQRVAMLRLAQQNPNGISAGQFFALSPENRKLYDELRGGEEGARLREEHRLAEKNGTALTPEQQSALQQKTQTTMDRKTSDGTAALQAHLAQQLALTAVANAAMEANSQATRDNTAALQALTVQFGGGGFRGHGAGGSWAPQTNPQSGGQVLGTPQGATLAPAANVGFRSLP